MRHEKIFRNEDKSRTRITVYFSAAYGKLNYSYSAGKAEYKKQAFKQPDAMNTREAWPMVSLSDLEKQQPLAWHKHEAYLTICTEEQINETLLEAWQKLKPELL